MASLDKHPTSGAWVVVSRLNGKKIKKYLGAVSKKEADAEKALATAREKEAKAGRVSVETAVVKTKSMTYAEFAPLYLAWRKDAMPGSYETVSIHVNNGVLWFGKLRIADDVASLDAWNAAFNNWESERSKVVGAETLKGEWKDIKASLYRAVRSGGKKAGRRWNLANTSPAAGLVLGLAETEGKKEKRIFSADELERIYAADPENAPIWRFMANTGLRRSEVEVLPKSMVESDSDRAKVRVAHNPGEGLNVKAKKSRSVPLNREARAARDEVIANPYPGDTFFPVWHKRTWTKKFNQAREAAGIDSGTLHSLRHTFISRAANNGVPIHLVMKWAGHSELETTMGYLHINEDYEWLEMDKMLDSESGKVVQLSNMRKAA